MVDSVPGYAPEIAANPFVTFRALPVNARYRFMLDEAQFTLMGFMKGPVCRGQVALSVINDHFWVVFLAPGAQENALTTVLLDAAAPNLNLPAEHENTVGLRDWRDYSKNEVLYLEEKSRLSRKMTGSNYKFGLTSLWDGDGKNPNAALTVFRHFDSASVVRGLVGERPQTVLTLGYPLFERMHYLLLAGFDVYGNVPHQLATRLYMDFLRMEGEVSFLALLPVAERKRVVDHWYRGGGEQQISYFANAMRGFTLDSAEKYRSSDPLGELYQRLSKRYLTLRERALDWAGSGLTSKEQAQIDRLSQIKGQPAAHMPEMSLVLLQKPEVAPQLMSLLSNAAHSNVAQMFSEDKRRLPEEDTLLAINGVAGAYPNAIFAVDAEKLPNFVDAVATLANADDLRKLVDRFGVRRTDPRFWPASDAVHAAWRKMAPREAAVLDYSRLDNL